MTPRIALFGAYALVFVMLPLVGDNYTLRLATFVCMYTALALSWNIIGGYTGYPSFSTAAFVGLGSYAGALLQKAGLPMVGAWIGATVVVALFAYCLGFAILRMRGHYFAIGSISIVEVLRLVTSSWSSFTGGGDGLNVPILAGGPEYAGRVFLYAMLVVMVLAFVTVVLVDRGRLGFGLRCIKQNEDAAAMVGVDTNRYKIYALTLSGVWCGTVGAIYASWVGYIAPTDSYSILLTLKVPVMALLGGEGTVWGPVIGALLFVLMEETIWAQFLDWNQAILGTVIVLLLFFLPGGLLRIDWRRILGRRAPSATTATTASEPSASKVRP